MVDFRTTFAGLKLKNPIIAGSSGLSNSLEKAKELDNAGVGAIVLKSLFEEQIENHAEKLERISEYPEAADYINTYIEMNHVEKYLDLIHSIKAECSVPVIASINCYRHSRWAEFARQVEKAGADALELNVLALNTAKFDDNYLEKSYQNIIEALQKVTKIPIAVKMARTLSNLPALIGRLNTSGVNSVVLFNRLYQLDIDIRNLEIVSGPVFSHPSDFSETLRWTAVVSGLYPELDIACSYGVHSWEDVVKGILVGASAIELCSVLYEKGLDVIGEMLTCLEEWMVQHGHNKISDFRGKLSYANIPDPSVYERVQFMKYFSNYQ